MGDFSEDRDFSNGIGVFTSVKRESILTASAIATQTQSDNVAIAHGLKKQDPELLQMAHNFASAQPSYLTVMQGLVLVYKALADQAAADRTLLH